MGVDEALNFLDGVHDEDVDKILASAVEPVVERRSALGELQVKNVDLLEDAFCIVQSLTATLSQGSQSVPLVADALATGVNTDTVVIIQCARQLKQLDLAT